MVFKRGEMIGCDIAVINSEDEILRTPLDFMLIGSVILSLLPCRMTMNIGSCQGRLLLLQPALETMREVEQEPHTNAVWLFMK